MKKNLLITFDYELFLGRRSGTVEKCLIKPTNLILDVFKKNKIKNAVFFVDTTFILKLLEHHNEAGKHDLSKIKKQLVDILQAGHYIFPHLHPHWLDAKYLKDINQWDLSDISRYRLHKLSIQEIEKLLNDSKTFIEEIQLEAGVKYSIDSYRAGGWCMQPFTYLKPVFEKSGIKNDFSVLSGFKNSNDNCFYDYSKAPEQLIYRFTDDIVKADEKGVFTEFAISCIDINKNTKLADRFYNKFLAYTGNVNFGDGLSNNLSADKQQDLNPHKEMVSIELLTKPKLKAYLRFFQSADYVHFISHPKMISRHNIKMIDKFFQETLSPEINTDYKNIR